MMHPYFSEQIAADRRQALMEEANRHRLSRQKSLPSPRRPLTAVLKRALRWLTPGSPTPIKTRPGPEPVTPTRAAPSSAAS
jgi:hypothetical protein